MNVDKLEVGNVYKNYKTLCEILNVQTKNGKSKSLQLKDWERYFEYDKQGHSFMITNIHGSTKDKTDLRKGGNNKVKYIEQIEKLILDLLVQDTNNGKVFLSRNKLLQTLKMVNWNYSYGKYKPARLSKHTNINKEGIADFYAISDNLLQRNLEAALTKLRSKALIVWSHTLTIGYIEANVKLNADLNVKATKQEEIDEDGDKIITFDVDKPEGNLIHKKASEDEQKLIIHTEREVLKEMNCKVIQDIYKKGIAESFYKKVNDILFDEANIYLYYNSYEIVYNNEHVYEEWKELEEIKEAQLNKKNTQSVLNEEIVNKLNINAEHRHKKAIRIYADEEKKKYKLRSNADYVSNNMILTDTLINKDTERINKQ
jgi:uncharacterized protein YegJ (DUF2314 family)